MSATTINEYIGNLNAENAPPPRNWLHGDFTVLDATESFLWPGAIVSGRSFMKGSSEPRQYPFKLNSFELSNSNGHSREVENPNMATVREALRELSRDTDAPSANASFSYFSASTMAELGISLNVYGSKWGATFGASASIDYDTSETLVAVEIRTRYFSIAMPRFASFEDLLDPSVTLADVEKEIPSNEYPLILSQLVYGHRAIIVARTQGTALEFTTAIEAAYEAAKTGGKLEVQYKETLDQATIEGEIFGVDAASAAKSISGVSGVEHFLEAYQGADPGISGIIGYELLDLMGDNISIPAGPVSVTLDSVQGKWTSGGTKASGNLQMFGELRVTTKVENSEIEPVWSVNNLGAKPARTSPSPDYWYKFKSKDQFETLNFYDTEIGTRAFTIDSYDGGFECFANIWDYYKGFTADNEQLGTDSSDEGGYSDFNPAGILHLDTEVSDPTWGSATVRFTFKLFQPSAMTLGYDRYAPNGEL